MPDGDKQAYQERLDRIAEIFASLVARAEVSARHRCPYRDRNDECTALFRCRNQLSMESDVEAFACGHDGAFDYRTAWQTNPRLQMRVRQKVADIKAEAEARRGGQDPEGISS